VEAANSRSRTLSRGTKTMARPSPSTTSSWVALVVPRKTWTVTACGKPSSYGRGPLHSGSSSSAVRPVSSRSSRRAASSGVSPGSIRADCGRNGQTAVLPNDSHPRSTDRPVDHRDGRGAWPRNGDGGARRDGLPLHLADLPGQCPGPNTGRAVDARAGGGRFPTQTQRRLVSVRRPSRLRGSSPHRRGDTIGF
jgi:hypothetical protein